MAQALVGKQGHHRPALVVGHDPARQAAGPEQPRCAVGRQQDCPGTIDSAGKVPFIGPQCGQRAGGLRKADRQVPSSDLGCVLGLFSRLRGESRLDNRGHNLGSLAQQHVVEVGTLLWRDRNCDLPPLTPQPAHCRLGGTAASAGCIVVGQNDDAVGLGWQLHLFEIRRRQGRPYRQTRT
jgi:hypothetical protein